MKCNTEATIGLCLCLLSALIMCIIITCVIHVFTTTDFYEEPEVLTGWHDVVCTDDNGETQSYTIPVPEFFSFSPGYTARYYVYMGEQFCDSIKDKTKYITDVGETL